MARVRSERGARLTPRNAESARTIIVKARGRSFGARPKRRPHQRSADGHRKGRTRRKCLSSAGEAPPKRAKKGRLRRLNRKSNKDTMNEFQAPQIENLQEITPERFKEYVTFVATMRHNQRRYFSTRNPQVLELSKDMEKELDALNAKLLDQQMKLF